MILSKSKITKQVLNYFFINPHESLYTNELARKLGLDKRNLVKKLHELETEGILKKEEKGNLKLYSINTGYPLYNEYKQIILKTTGLEDRLKKAIKCITGAKKAFVYGSYAQGKLSGYSDIDILVAGNHDIAELQKKINRIQKEIGREINIVNMGITDFEKKKKSGDPFISGILKGKHIELI